MAKILRLTIAERFRRARRLVSSRARGGAGSATSAASARACSSRGDASRPRRA